MPGEQRRVFPDYLQFGLDSSVSPSEIRASLEGAHREAVPALDAARIFPWVLWNSARGQSAFSYTSSVRIPYPFVLRGLDWTVRTFGAGVVDDTLWMIRVATEAAANVNVWNDSAPLSAGANVNSPFLPTGHTYIGPLFLPVLLPWCHLIVRTAGNTGTGSYDFSVIALVTPLGDILP